MSAGKEALYYRFVDVIDYLLYDELFIGGERTECAEDVDSYLEPDDSGFGREFFCFDPINDPAYIFYADSGFSERADGGDDGFDVNVWIVCVSHNSIRSVWR